jgi:predicted DNA binding CopG/RHH family protein
MTMPETITRTVPISLRFEEDTLERLKRLAERKGIGYQTLLKTFVTERLYEEEKREGVFTAVA